MSPEQVVWSWARHLRTGGTTTWQSWVAAGADGPGDGDPVPTGRPVPGAAQLEFVRRAAAHRAGGVAGGAPGGVTGGFPALADLVTSRSGPGRGLAQQPLLWPADPQETSPTGPTGGTGAVGPPPVDPSAVPVEELVRVGVGALTELLLEAPDLPPGAAALRRHPFTRTPAFALAGAPITTAAVRHALGAAGHVEGGGSPRVVLIAEPFDHALAQVWSARVQGGAPVRWRGFVARWSGRRDLPPSVDLPAVARAWADRVGVGEVHVVAAAGGVDATTRAVADVLGLAPGPARRARRGAGAPDRWQDLPAAGVDVLRRVNAVLGVRVSDEAHARARRRLVATLAATRRPGPPGQVLTVPPRFQDWARRRGGQLADDLVAGGYPVHGPLGTLVPRGASTELPTRPRPADVLEVVLAACLELAQDGPARDAEGAVTR